MKTPIPPLWKVPEVFLARLGKTAGRQRAMFNEGHLLLILHRAPEPGAAEREARFFWREPSGAWHSSGSGRGLPELQEHLSEFTRKADALEDRIQEDQSAESFYHVLQGSAPLLRTARNLHSTLQQAREACPEAREIIAFRDQAGEIERTVDLLHGDAKNGLEFMVARQSELQARTGQELVAAGHRLNLLAAIFLPLAAIGSAFGMNLQHGLEEAGAPWMFWMILIIGLMIGFALKSAISVRAGKL
jgi:hypothetical protein